MELYLIRHAQSMNNANPQARVEDAPLTELGHQQAVRLAERVRQTNLTQLFTSPFRRTLETTNYIKEITALTPEIWIDLHEQGGVISGTDSSSYTGRPGMTRTEILHSFPGYILPQEIDEQGWWKSKPFETMAEAQKRAERVAQRIMACFAHTEERIGFVSHGTFIRLLIGALVGSSVIERDWIGEVFNTSVAKLRITPKQTRLELFNCVCHLPPTLLS